MKTAVISGGNGGLGRALASALQAQGWRTVLLDLTVDGLETTAQQWPIACDLTDPAQLEDAVAKITERWGTVDLAVYNAGITQIGAFEDMTDATMRKVFEINYFAATNMARHLLEPVRQAKGTHLAISSVAGFSPLYHRTAYAASKHALEGFFSSLRSEESGYGVRTLIAAPSFVATNIGNSGAASDGTARPGSAGDGIDYMSPNEAAAIILRAVDRKAAFVPVGRIAQISHLLYRFNPRLYQRVMERQIEGS